MATPSYLLQENGDFLLQENGDKIILETTLQRGLIYMRSKQQSSPTPLDRTAGVPKMRRKSNQNPLAMDDKAVL